MKVKLDEAIDMIYSVDRETNAYYNPIDNAFFFSNIGDYEDLDEDELDDLFDKSIILPTSYEIDEYHLMEEFINTVENDDFRNQLMTAINGRGAFRCFKDTCFRLGIINDWYKFRDDKYKDIAIEWCKSNNIDYE